MSEPGAGSDLQGFKINAIADGDHYTLNSFKTFITNGQSDRPLAGRARLSDLLIIELHRWGAVLASEVDDEFFG